MQEDQAHRLYMNMRRGGQGAAMRRNGLGFQNGGPPPYLPGPGMHPMMGGGPPVVQFGGPANFSRPPMMPPQHGIGPQNGMGPPIMALNLPPPPMRPGPRQMGPPGPAPPNARMVLNNGFPQVGQPHPQMLPGQLGNRDHPSIQGSQPPNSKSAMGPLNSGPLDIPRQPLTSYPMPNSSGPVQFNQEALTASIRNSVEGRDLSNGGLKREDDKPKGEDELMMGPQEKPKTLPANPKENVDEEDKEKINQAWAMHKTEDGKEYYYNSLTNESSWTKPDGFIGQFSEAKPTSQLRVPNTDWFEIHCEDGRKYFYNEVTQETSWSEPVEVVALKQRVKEAKSQPIVLPQTSKPKSNVKKEVQEPPALKRGREIEAIIPGVTQPPLPQEIPPPMPPPERLRKRSWESISEDFFDLLTEQQITAFSLWEKELPKLIKDPRYQAVASLKERRGLFEEFCKKNTGDRKRQKTNANSEPQKLSKDAIPSDTEEAQNNFKALLQEAVKGQEHFSDIGYSEFSAQFSKDARWQACTEDVRRSLFDEKKKELVSTKKQASKSDLASLTKDYRALLVAHKINGVSRWSKMKEILAKDPRFKAFPKDSQEPVFRDFVAEQKKLEDEREREKQEREKRDRALKDRMKREAEEAENRQKKAAHTDAMANYSTLLSEMVKDVNARWSEWKPRLQRDPQGRANNPAMSQSEAEQKFKEHVHALQKKCQAAFVSLMDQVLRPLLPASKKDDLPSELKSFTKAEKLWQDDTRAVRVDNKDRERLFRRFVEEIILERDDPKKLARRSQLSTKRQGTENVPKVSRYGEEGPDRAYEREYLDHDRKRLRKK